MAQHDEVEEFLRRAAARRAAQAEAQQPQPPQVRPPAQPPAAQRRQPKPVKQSGAQPRKAPARLSQSAPAPNAYLQPLDAEVIDAELVDSQNRIGAAVTRDMSRSQAVGQHAAHLGEVVGLADDKMDAQIHQLLDHKLGRLKQDLVAPPTASPTTTSDLTLGVVRMLRTPQSLQQAIILNEIMNRPVDRW